MRISGGAGGDYYRSRANPKKTEPAKKKAKPKTQLEMDPGRRDLRELSPIKQQELKRHNEKEIRRGRADSGLQSDELRVAEDILSRRPHLHSKVGDHILGERNIRDKWFKSDSNEGVKAPEGLIATGIPERRNPNYRHNQALEFTAFEVKNQGQPDISHAVKKFADLFNDDNYSSQLSPQDIAKRKRSITRLDVYVPSGLDGQPNGDIPPPYGVSPQGYLTETFMDDKTGKEETKEVTFNNGQTDLRVHVIKKNLPDK